VALGFVVVVRPKSKPCPESITNSFFQKRRLYERFN